MRKVSILTTRNLKSKLYFFPLHLHQRKLQEAGLAFKHLYKISPDLFDSDQIVVDQQFVRDLWKERHEEMLSFLEDAKKNCQKLHWFDTTASTSIRQPEVLPYVDAYHKALVLRDPDIYSAPLYSNRIFSDYYHRNLGITDSHPPEPLYVKDTKDVDKIKLSWNYSLAGFIGIKTRVYNRLREILPIPYFYSVKFTSPENKRSHDISCRTVFEYGRETISYQRSELVSLLKEKYRIDISRIPHTQYLRELRQTKLVPSPFGWGEINYRDFEIIPCGAALMKPDMEHLETWPSLYRKDETYISHRWDLSDVEEKINLYLQEKRWMEVAQNAQDLYRKYLYSSEGHDEFIGRIIGIFGIND